MYVMNQNSGQTNIYKKKSILMAPSYLNLSYDTSETYNRIELTPPYTLVNIIQIQYTFQTFFSNQDTKTYQQQETAFS